MYYKTILQLFRHASNSDHVATLITKYNKRTLVSVFTYLEREIQAHHKLRIC